MSAKNLILIFAEKNMKETFDDKYTVMFDEKTGELKALRYEEEWQDLTGNGLILAMLQEVHELRIHNDKLTKEADFFRNLCWR